jgi:hypothetical protein
MASRESCARYFNDVGEADDEAYDDAADELVASRRLIVLKEPPPITCGMRCSSGCSLSLRERIAGKLA